MILVKLKDSGKVIEVTRNVAHGMIESGEAELLNASQGTDNKMMLPEDAPRGPMVDIRSIPSKPKRGYVIK